MDDDKEHLLASNMNISTETLLDQSDQDKYSQMENNRMKAIYHGVRPTRKSTLLCLGGYIVCLHVGLVLALLARNELLKDALALPRKIYSK